MKSHCSSVSRHLIILQPINQVFWQKFERRRSNTCLLAYLQNSHPWHGWHDKSDHSGYSSFSHHYSGWIDFNTMALFVAQKGWISWYITTLGNCLVVGDLQQPITPFLSAVCAFNIFQLVLLQLHLLLWGCASLKQFRGKVVALRFSCW